MEKIAPGDREEIIEALGPEITELIEVERIRARAETIKAVLEFLYRLFDAEVPAEAEKPKPKPQQRFDA